MPLFFAAFGVFRWRMRESKKAGRAPAQSARKAPEKRRPSRRA
jgi:hypothetical protein